jgi:hypothetical protein
MLHSALPGVLTHERKICRNSTQKILSIESCAKVNCDSDIKIHVVSDHDTTLFILTISRYAGITECKSHLPLAGVLSPRRPFPILLCRDGIQQVALV